MYIKLGQNTSRNGKLWIELKVMSEMIQTGIALICWKSTQSRMIFPVKIVMNTTYPYSKYDFSNIFKKVIIR